MKIFKQELGDNKNEKIVIFHGWGCDHQHMQPIAELLSQQYYVINYDLPGRGKSDWNHQFRSIDDIADHLLPELPEKAIYIGWSIGGPIIMSIAARYPEKVTRFIGIGTSPNFIEDKNWPGFPKPGFLLPFKEGLEAMGYTAFMRGYLDNEFRHFAEPKPPELQALYDIADNSPETNLEVLYNGIKIVDHTDMRDSYKALTCPIDLIWGGDDDCVPNEAHQAILALNSNANAHTIPGAHHMMFWTHKEEFNNILKQILLAD